jgi:hypothetical protein
MARREVYEEYNKDCANSNCKKGNWKQELMVFLCNYRATPHQTTGKPPAELMFPNRNFKTKVPTMKLVTPYHHDKEVREYDQKKKR